MSQIKHRFGYSLALVLGDTLALILFSALGRAEHKLALSVSGILITTLPFWLVWMIVGTWLRVFAPEAVLSPPTALRRVIVPWLITLPWAILLRAVLLDGLTGTVHVLFAFITLVTVYIFLAGWRALYALWLKRRKSPPADEPLSQ